MKKTGTSQLELSNSGKVRPLPLTLEQVLRLRDGLNIVRGDVPGYPVQIVLPNYNRKEWTVVFMN